MCFFACHRGSHWTKPSCLHYYYLLNLISVFHIGRDCMGCAKTGSGKTAAFVLPVLQKLSEDPYGVFCLVLTPTRFTFYFISRTLKSLFTNTVDISNKWHNFCLFSVQRACLPDCRTVQSIREALRLKGLHRCGRNG